ncbi:MAG TPA: carboxymuconolactone decarboxylase family protein [Candidatus Acidoferrales bacterium]
MEQRYAKIAPEPFKILLSVEKYLHECGIEESILHLVKLRASQINRCAHCIEMHWKDLVSIGESEQRVYSLDAWRECPWFNDRERAALAWTESVTLLTDGFVADSVYDEVRQHFSEDEMGNLALVVAMINSWNRLNVAARTVPGSYGPPPKVKAGKS